MGFSISGAVDSAVGAVKGAVNDIAKRLGLPSPFAADGGNASSLLQQFENDFPNQIWSIRGDDWYQVYGYQFSI